MGVLSGFRRSNPFHSIVWGITDLGVLLRNLEEKPQNLEEESRNLEELRQNYEGSRQNLEVSPQNLEESLQNLEVSAQDFEVSRQNLEELRLDLEGNPSFESWKSGCTLKAGNLRARDRQLEESC